MVDVFGFWEVGGEGRPSEGDAERGGRRSGGGGAAGLEQYGDRNSGSPSREVGEKKAVVKVLCTSFFLFSDAMVGWLVGYWLALKAVGSDRWCCCMRIGRSIVFPISHPCTQKILKRCYIYTLR